MKKIALITLIAFSGKLMAQSDKYVKTMEARVSESDTTFTFDHLVSLSSAFERVADAEKAQWLPYYYASLMEVKAGFMLFNGVTSNVSDKTDPMADRAESLLSKAESLSPNNSEIYVIKKMIATLRMIGNPMARYMTYGPQAAEALKTARQLDPNNPRTYYLEGLDKYQTPEQYGGSKTEAKKIFTTAIEKFDAAKPASSIDPHWGRKETEYFLSQIK